MARGGKREGAGRKRGSLTVRTRKIAEKHEAKGGMMPLDVMLRAMGEHASADRWDQAAAIAKDAAPYCHPKLQAIMHGGPDGKDLKLTISWERDA